MEEVARKFDALKVMKRYSIMVLNGKISACKFVRQACQRFVDDLKKYPKGSAFYFDNKEATRCCAFVQQLKHFKGPLAGKKICLEPWQIFILGNAFGWKAKDGSRRFRNVYIEVPRGNGKSTLSSAVGLFALAMDNEPGAEIYSFATTADQAAIVFGDAKVMAENNPALEKYLGVETAAHSIFVKKSNSKFQAKNAEGSTQDGLNPHVAICDELHAWKGRPLYDVIVSALGKRDRSMLWAITTAGFNLSGVCYEIRSYVLNVLQGLVEDDTQFGIIFTIDEGDDWNCEEALKKANPNWGISVRPAYVLSELKKAALIAAKQNNFKTKYLNMWCNANTAWINLKDWDACADDSLSIDDFTDEPLFIGDDLASKRDFAAKAYIFVRKIDGKNHYFLFNDFYLPELTIEKSTNAAIKGWVEDGYIKKMPGAVIDFDMIEEDERQALSRFNLQLSGFDPWQAAQYSKHLSDEGAPMKEVRQTVAQMSEPMKTFEALVLDKRIHHNGNPVMRWMISNVVCHKDVKDNIYPRKERDENKIDGVVASIIGLSLINDEVEKKPDISSFTDSPLVFSY